MKQLSGILSIFTISAAVLIQPSFAAKPECTYQLEPESVKVGWTAYKTTDKVAVNGTMKDLQFTTPKRPLRNFKALLAMTRATGAIDNEKKSDSGNPARDATLFQKFFSVMNGTKIAGNITHLKGDEKKGDFDLYLSLNGKGKSVPMKYTYANQQFEAKGELNMLDFGMDKPLESLHKACEELHKGKDGVSKTWPNVGLTISAKINKDCSAKAPQAKKTVEGHGKPHLPPTPTQNK